MILADGGCFSAALLLTLLPLFAVALLFCDPVTKLSKDEDTVVPLAALFCALFQVASGTVAMAVSVAALVFLALNAAAVDSAVF